MHFDANTCVVRRGVGYHNSWVILVNREWLLDTKMEKLQQMIMTGAIVVDRFVVPSESTPQFDEKPPPKPLLKVCVFTDTTTDEPRTIQLSPSLFAKWQGHELFGSQFTELVTKITTLFPTEPMLESEGPSPKKPRLDYDQAMHPQLYNTC